MVYIPGTAGNDTLTGSVLDDVIEGFGGFDVISAAAGNDSVTATTGGDVIFGNAGNDTLFANFLGASNPSTIYGGADNDQIDATLGNDTVYGDLGSDTIRGIAGDDLLIGTNINNDQLSDLGDRISGNSGNDVIYGNAGNDTLFGDDSNSTGNDTLYGGRDNDLVLGDAGDDYLYGNLGNDTIRGFVPGNVSLPYGVNYMTGNDGNDNFRTSSDAVFTTSSLDYILDFTGNGNASTGDSLNFNSTSIGSGFTILQIASGADLVLRVTKPNGYQDDFAVLVGRADLAGILPIEITSLMVSSPSIASASSLDIVGVEEKFIKAIALKQEGKSIAEPEASPISPSDYPKFDLKASYQNDLIVTNDGLVGRAITITEADYNAGKLTSVLPKWLTISFVEEAIVADKSPIL
jgi:RTX calcium-binding nonapeptide repeat (4 copies)